MTKLLGLILLLFLLSSSSDAAEFVHKDGRPLTAAETQEAAKLDAFYRKSCEDALSSDPHTHTLYNESVGKGAPSQNFIAAAEISDMRKQCLQNLYAGNPLMSDLAVQE